VYRFGTLLDRLLLSRASPCGLRIHHKAPLPTA
jgi:hypothetical protein